MIRGVYSDGSGKILNREDLEDLENAKDNIFKLTTSFSLHDRPLCYYSQSET